MKILPIMIIGLFSLPVLIFGDYLIMVDKSLMNFELLFSYRCFTQVDYLEDKVIVISDDKGLSILNNNIIPYVILDIDPRPGHYFLAEKVSHLDINSLKSTIKILYYGTDYYLIKIGSSDDLLSLNMLGLELKHISFHPLVTKCELPPKRTLFRDTLIQAMVNEVNYDTIINNVRRLQNFRTRYSTTDSARSCANWIMSKFIAYGYDSVFLDTFSASYAPNVVAIKYGMVHSPKSYVVACGHFDCTSQSPLSFAPGADDNGSGTAYVLELARILRNYLFEHSIYLIAFCGEEQGLIGSDYFASRAYQRNDTILGAINMDMFAYTTPNRDTLTIINDTTYINNLWLAQLFSACADSYTTLKKKIWTGRRPNSDHASFSRYGYYAIQGRENLSVSNPYYHTTGDTIGGGYNADTMVFKGIKAGLATVATLAIPYYITGVTEKKLPVHKSQLHINLFPLVRKNDRIKFFGYSPFSGILSIKLYDVSGRIKVKTKKFINNPGFFSGMIDIPMNSGVYFALFEIKGIKAQKKIVILD